MKFEIKIQKEIKPELKEILESLDKFSLTLDELTSKRNQYYTSQFASH